MIDSQQLLAALQKQVTKLENDFRARCIADPKVDAPLKADYEKAKASGRVASTYSAWRDEEITQAAVAWVLACVFVRFLEDNELIETPYLSGPGPRLQRAKDEHEVFFRTNPTLSEREYLEHVFGIIGKLPGMKEFFDRKHNPLWRVGPTADAAVELLDFWRRTNPDTGLLDHDFTDSAWNTRFLGDLYQDLSEYAKKRYALLQTPIFVEEFILDRTLTPAIQTFGYQVVRMIDPTCGSGHFLLGGFARLFRLWQEHKPGENPRVLVQKALDQVYGVDLNPNVIAIARFRLLLAALHACGVKRLKDAPDFRINLATGDSLLHGSRFRAFESKTGPQMTFDTEEAFRDELKHFYDVEDRDELRRILGQQYHAVVGNPPYITVKDKALSELYRARYGSCHRQYSLSVPFMERFFDLAVKGDDISYQPAGFVGQITANSFMKAEFGKKLVEDFVPRWDLTHVIDTSGAKIPGHDTPTAILFGRNQPPIAVTIRTVLGIRSDTTTQDAPDEGAVWAAICRQVDDAGSISLWVSSSDSQRIKLHKHPWSIGGGGASELKAVLEAAADSTLGECIADIGRTTHTGEDDAFCLPESAAKRFNIDAYCVPIVAGDNVRDHQIQADEVALFPYESKTGKPIPADTLPRRLTAHLWALSRILRSRQDFGQLIEDRGLAWYEHSMFFPRRYQARLAIGFAFVATHNHFVIDHHGKVFNRTAPVIILPSAVQLDEHQRLSGILNSSAACFWARQTFFPRGGFAEGKWQERFNWNSTPLERFPLPRYRSSALPAAIYALAAELKNCLPASAVETWCASGIGDLREHLTQVQVLSTAHRRMLIACQEELDWQIYESYGLIASSDAVSQPDGKVEIPPSGIELGERAFEIFMARKMAAGELQTTWFERHGSKPITEIPKHWPKAYRDMVERRIKLIETDRNIGLIEQPEYKRRWNTEPWDEQLERALRDWLLARLEGYFFEGSRVCEIKDGFDPVKSGFPAAAQPRLVSTNQLAEVVQTDKAFMQVAELYAKSTGFSVPKLVRELVESESVPNLPVHRYKESGLRHRKDWEHVWDLQRKEDAVEAEVRAQHPGEKEEILKPLIRKAQLEQVGEIPVPPKYASKDFQKTSCWRLRGKLDVPKERWVLYVGAEKDGDPSPMIAWAGWNHVQQAQALAEYYLNAKESQGWPPRKLKLLLAGLLDLLPWLKQWHNNVDPDLGMGLGDYYAGFVDEQCRGLGLSLNEVDAARFKATSIAVPVKHTDSECLEEV